MMLSGKTVVFLGPSMNPQKAKLLVDAEFRPPAAMGDITRAVRDRARLIVLVDGVFENGPSVWHKEILWALAEGVPVIGASSMGALRAAELHDFGMLGHGEVFDDFASGLLEDDDEVAVLHGPEDSNWVPLTDAMVDIRWRAGQAVTDGVLQKDEFSRLVLHAKTTFFKQRCLLESLQVALAVSRHQTERRHVIEWFAARKTGVKESDCLSVMMNLPKLSIEANAKLERVPAFLPTVYLSRLQQFGFSFQE